VGGQDRPNGFIAARVGSAITPAVAVPCIRVELGGASRRIDLHWPLAHSRELANWLREFSQ
jgi:hypothetical protein